MGAKGVREGEKYVLSIGGHTNWLEERLKQYNVNDVSGRNINKE